MKPRWHIWLFLLPGLLAYTMFKLLPTVAALGLSLTEWTGLSAQIEFAGIDNYVRLFKDATFHKAFGNNVRFSAVVIVFQTLISLGMALMVVKNTKWNVMFRTLFFVPLILSSVSISFIWAFLYDPNIGIINSLLALVDIKGKAWLSDPKIVLYSLALIQIWTYAGQLCVIFVAGLQTIPETLYEAASIEGAGRWQIFRYVTWPLLAPATAVVMTLVTIQSFRAFDLIWVLTQGGPARASDIMSTFIYSQAFISFRFGYAAATAVIFLLIIGVITIIQFKLLKARQVTYQ